MAFAPFSARTYRGMFAASSPPFSLFFDDSGVISDGGGGASSGNVSGAPSPSSASPAPIEKCHTLEFSGPDAVTTILVQTALGLVCGGTLLVKYFCFEKPRRPCCVWFWDISKQALGAALAHLYNLILAAILAGNTSEGDACAWYFINISIDTFLGVFLQFILLEMIERDARRRGCASLAVSGDYGNPPRHSWWMIQLAVYSLVVTLVKFSIFVFVYFARDVLGQFGKWLFSPLIHLPTVELVIVMVVAPGLMNAWQFWVTDTFVMMVTEKGGQRYPSWCCFLCRITCGWPRPRGADDVGRVGGSASQALLADDDESMVFVGSAKGRSRVSSVDGGGAGAGMGVQGDMLEDLVNGDKDDDLDDQI